MNNQARIAVRVLVSLILCTVAAWKAWPVTFGEFGTSLGVVLLLSSALSSFSLYGVVKFFRGASCT